MAFEVENSGIVGAAGNFIAAVLETAGFYAQGHVLNEFSGILASIGGLVFAVYVAGAIFSFAVFGSYRKSFYLLLAPALFAFMLNNTTNITAVGHRFGVSDRDPSGTKVIEALQNSEELGVVAQGGDAGVDSRYSGQATVSSFVVMYDRMVSSVVQGLVSFIIDTQRNKDLQSLMREKVFRRVSEIRIEDQKYIKLLSIVVYGKCAEQNDLSFRISRLVDSDSVADQETVVILLNRLELIQNERIALPKDLAKYVGGFGVNLSEASSITCAEAWLAAGVITNKIAQDVLSKPPAEQADYPDLNWQEVLSDVQKKFQSEEATNVDVAKAGEVLASMIMRNTLNSTPHHLMTTQLEGRQDWNRQALSAGMGDFALAPASGERLKMIWFASFLPYLQGALLYVLAISFPFFALFLLIPSRAHTFFMWCSLWLWVKSWDVGMAFVHFVREVFWNLMPHVERARSGSQFGNNIDWSSEGSHTVFNAMFNSDPTAHHNTYYMIIGLFTVSIPFVTAHLCLGATNIWDALKGGIDQSANSFLADKEKEGKGIVRDDQHQSLAAEMGIATGTGALEGIEKGKTAPIAGRENEGNADRRWDQGAALQRFAGAGALANEANKVYQDPGLRRYMALTGAHAGRRDPRYRHGAKGVLEGKFNEMREQYEVTGNAMDSAMNTGRGYDIVGTSESAGLATNDDQGLSAGSKKGQVIGGDDGGDD